MLHRTSIFLLVSTRPNPRLTQLRSHTRMGITPFQLRLTTLVNSVGSSRLRHTRIQRMKSLRLSLNSSTKKEPDILKGKLIAVILVILRSHLQMVGTLKVSSSLKWSFPMWKWCTNKALKSLQSGKAKFNQMENFTRIQMASSSWSEHGGKVRTLKAFPQTTIPSLQWSGLKMRIERWLC